MYYKFTFKLKSDSGLHKVITYGRDLTIAISKVLLQEGAPLSAVHSINVRIFNPTTKL